MSVHHQTPEVRAVLRELRPIIKASLPAACIRCGREVNDAMQWHVGHRVDLAKGGDPRDAGPEHARCNLVAGGKAGAAKTNAGKRTVTMQDRRLPSW